MTNIPKEKKYPQDRERSWIRETSRKLRVIRDLGGVCKICGLDGMKEPWLIDIHHIDPSKKEMDPNKMYDYPYKVFQEEMKNCTLLCANCHRSHHNAAYKERYERYKDVLQEKVDNAHIDFWEERGRQNDIIDKKVIELLKEGLSMGEMAKILGVSKSAIHKYMKRANVVPNYSPMSPGKVDENTFARIKELKAKGMNSRQIGRELGLSKTTVLNHWSRD
jgi:DNA-binding CsgD family transcriptional regulator